MKKLLLILAFCLPACGQSLQTCIAASASSTTYTCTSSGTISSLTNGLTIAFQADVTNTGAITLNVNTLGAKAVNKQGGLQPLIIGDVIASQWLLLTYDGTQWQDHTQIGRANIPSFTWDNQAGSTVTNIQNTERLQAASASGVIHARYTTAPSPPYSLTVQIIPDQTQCNTFDCNYGLIFRQSSTGKITIFQISKRGDNVPYLLVDNWTNSTTFSGSAIAQVASVVYNPLQGFYAQVQPCVRITDDNTNLSFWYSLDCINFQQFGGNIARGSFMTGGPDQIGYTAGEFSSGSSAVTLMRWVTQ